jgi:hypothetical protein
LGRRALLIRAEIKAENLLSGCLGASSPDMSEKLPPGVAPDDMILSILPYAHERGGVAILPEDMGKTKARAVQAMEEQVGSQLKQIYGQVEILARQAQTLRRRMEISERLYAADFRHEPLIGHTYFIYLRENGTWWASLIEPGAWPGAGRKHLATVKLLADHTWEILEDRGLPIETN